MNAFKTRDEALAHNPGKTSKGNDRRLVVIKDRAGNPVCFVWSSRSTAAKNLAEVLGYAVDYDTDGEENGAAGNPLAGIFAEANGAEGGAKGRKAKG